MMMVPLTAWLILAGEMAICLSKHRLLQSVLQQLNALMFTYGTKRIL
jgi:hypothetical protein